MSAPLEVLVWVDFLDPWSWIAATRVERVQQELGDRVTVGYRAFLGVLEPETRTVEEYRTLTTTWLDPAAREPSLSFSVWRDAAPPTHSAPAQVAARVAEQVAPERAAAYRERLFAAHFAEGRTISDSAVLIALAAEAGLRADDFAMVLRGTYAEQVKGVVEEHREALRLGIAEPPGLVTGGYLIRGSAAQATYRELVRRVLDTSSDAEQPEATTEAAAGDA